MGGKKYVKKMYEVARSMDQQSITILSDKQTKTIINNESAEIVRMLGTVLRPAISKSFERVGSLLCRQGSRD